MKKTAKKAALLALCVTGCATAIPAGLAPRAASQARNATPRETLVWSDEFNRREPASQTRPDPANWTYDAGNSGFGNEELETYCAWGSKVSPCDATRPSAYVGGDGYLHITARSLGSGVYTSARLKSQGLRSFQYGRIEARVKIPEGQGIWSAFWMLGDSITTANWPACGEIDIMENIGKTPGTAYGSIHAPGGDLTRQYTLPNGGKLAEDFHTYGIIWSPGKIQFYIDTPANIYATYTPADLPKGAKWPFDQGKFFLIVNLAVGGKWPGNPDATTPFPGEMLVDYVRVYSQTVAAAP